MGPFRVVSGPIDAEALRRAVASNASGAVVLFFGTVRDRTADRRVERLEYEAYPAMAEAVMRDLGEAVAARHGLEGLACVHRTGRLELGETAVVVGAASPHRRAALEAIDDFIARMKQDVPIWKKEHFEGGARWIGTPEDPQATKGGS